MTVDGVLVSLGTSDLVMGTVSEALEASKTRGCWHKSFPWTRRDGKKLGQGRQPQRFWVKLL